MNAPDTTARLDRIEKALDRDRQAPLLAELEAISKQLAAIEGAADGSVSTTIRDSRSRLDEVLKGFSDGVQAPPAPLAVPVVDVSTTVDVPAPDVRAEPPAPTGFSSTPSAPGAIGTNPAPTTPNLPADPARGQDAPAVIKSAGTDTDWPMCITERTR